MTLILASGSPRRRELMTRITNDFEVIVSDVDETVAGSVTPKEHVAILAGRKANIVAKDHPGQIVIGCDTIVVLGDKILEKPKDDLEAKKMLRLLSGTTHQAMTAVHIVKGSQISAEVAVTDVTFFSLTDAEIDRYIETGEHRDKAGAYGIQGYGSLLVEKIAGDFFTIVGFPVAQVYQMLKHFDY